MSNCNCCDNPRISQKCRKHNQHPLSLLCSNKNCMEPMCINCMAQHKRIHEQLNLTQPALVDLREVQDFMIDSAKKQLTTVEQVKEKIHKPAQAMYKCIDRFFYGSTERREKLLKDRVKNMKSNFTAQVLVNSIEDDHQFLITQGFKERYFSFLDQLVNEAARKNQTNLLPQKYPARR